jgi:ubiquinone/menaquinone biosynthesis C-methylase UbiE
MSIDPHQPQNTYVNDPESGAEMARLIDQAKCLNEAMGTLFPPAVDLSSIQRVLDIACGPGEWAQEVAFASPEIEVVGIDLSQAMIAFANQQAQVQFLDNISFQLMDVRQSLAFPGESFDLVNARFLLSFLPREEWPQVVKEFARVTRPGGTIVLTEFDAFGEDTTSRAFEEYIGYMYQAMYQIGLYSGPQTGVTSRLEHFLREAGCQAIQKQWHQLDFSAGAPAHSTIYHTNLFVGMKLVQPFLLKTGVATQEHLNALYEQVLFDALQPDFRAYWNFLRVWGTRSS